MKKYKLIKEYPGSPSLGTIAKYSESHGAIEFTSPKGKLHYSESDAINFFENLVSNHPEFWEEVVVKDYEILSYKSLKEGHILFYNEKYDKNFFNNDNWIIHSVKRLSDGEVFTVGDKIQTCYKSTNSKNVIKEFNIVKDKIIIITHITSEYNNFKAPVKLKNIQHIQKLLFTTEDGVDIYENQNCFYVRQELEKVELFYCSKDFWQGNLDIYKWFSTKEKAEEYIINNKPCLSIQEVMNNIEFNPHWSASEFLKIIRMNLETEVKQKIK